MKKNWLTGLAVFLFFAVQAHAEETIITVCNHNADRAIFTTYLKDAGAGAGWQSQGWFKVASQACTDIDLGVYTGNAYFYAEDEFKQTSWGEGAETFCVNKTDGFVINNADIASCTDPTLKKVNSDELSVKPGKTTWDVEPNVSQLNFCNQNTAVSVFASLAWPQNNVLTSSGWYEVKAGQCRLVTVGKYTGPVSYYGEYNGGTLAWTGTATPYCVNKTNAFTLANADQSSSCADPSLKMVKAREINTVVGANTVNFEAVNTDSFLNLCNNTTDKVLEASYATNVNSLWPSAGWTAMNPGKCTLVDLGTYTGNVYVYAEWNQGQMFWGGTTSFNFCVHRTQNFSIADSTNVSACNSNTLQKMVPGIPGTVGIGPTTFNFN
jgi:uncharacterized membrane protein